LPPKFARQNGIVWSGRLTLVLYTATAMVVLVGCSGGSGPDHISMGEVAKAFAREGIVFDERMDPAGPAVLSDRPIPQFANPNVATGLTVYVFDTESEAVVLAEHQAGVYYSEVEVIRVGNVVAMLGSAAQAQSSQAHAAMARLKH
jgi:hypothetical protein